VFAAILTSGNFTSPLPYFLPLPLKHGALWHLSSSSRTCIRRVIQTLLCTIRMIFGTALQQQQQRRTRNQPNWKFTESSEQIGWSPSASGRDRSSPGRVASIRAAGYADNCLPPDRPALLPFVYVNCLHTGARPTASPPARTNSCDVKHLSVAGVLALVPPLCFTPTRKLENC